MSFIRGKIESPREIVQTHITVGGPSPFAQCDCGCEKWFDKETGAECRVTTLDELFKEVKLDNRLCGANPTPEANQNERE